MALRRGLLDQHLLAELEDRERSRDEQQDQDEDEDEEAAGAHWPGALLGVAARGNRANVPKVRTNGGVCARTVECVRPYFSRRAATSSFLS